LVQVGANPEPERLRSAAPFARNVRFNGVLVEASSAPGNVADAVAFVVSPRGAGVDGVTLPVA
jgi:hypothetical protein